MPALAHLEQGRFRSHLIYGCKLSSVSLEIAPSGIHGREPKTDLATTASLTAKGVQFVSKSSASS